MKNNINFVKSVINEWDPIGLLCHAPEDEYSLEISKVQELIYQTSNVEDLSEGIYKIFVESFGKNVFVNSKAECKQIAFMLLARNI